VEGKDQIFIIKWDSLCKHVGRKKAKRNIGTNVKKRDWYHFKDCKHAKNHKLFASCNQGNVVAQLANGMAGENLRKVVQFTTFLHLLQQGCPMQEYEAIRPLDELLAMPKNSKKHWIDSSSWTMIEFMHHEVMRATRVTMEVVRYVVLSCDDVSIVDNQYWLSIHYYVMGICNLWWFTFVMKQCFFPTYPLFKCLW
jgi:hypothetical protein